MVLVFTADEMLYSGLKVAGYSTKKVNASSYANNNYRFRCFFGVLPLVAANVFYDLQTTMCAEAKVPTNSVNAKHFLMALHHLKCYPTEIEREPMFDISPSYGRDWCWYYIEKIQALKETKIVWDDGDEDLWILSVDGIHCWIQEPGHPTWSQDRTYFSHKYAKAGLGYELALSLKRNQLIWMRGPYKAGRNDKTNFVEPNGLRDKLVSIGKKGLGDQGYVGHEHCLSTPNPHDSAEVKRFKSRAMMRHETFNGMIKQFKCLNGRFRHSIDRFKSCFEAVAVLCQYQIESDRPLFDILLPNMNYSRRRTVN